MIVSLPIHLACAALVGADMIARALRIRLLVTRLGARLSLADAIRLNLLGDAAAELTPFRIAGEPSRVAALLQAGVRSDPALLAVGAEFALSYAVVGLLIIASAWATVPAWWSSIGPRLHHAVSSIPVWAVPPIALALGISFPLMRRLRVPAHFPRPAGIQSSLRAIARIGARDVAAIFALSGINTAARVGILWVLASALPGAPAAGAVLVGSFILLFGQAFAPTPSGLGVVDAGVLYGAAGGFGEHSVSVLVYWRAYTAILPIALAAAFALPRFGARPLAALLGRRRARRSIPDGVEQAAAAVPAPLMPAEQ